MSLNAQGQVVRLTHTELDWLTLPLQSDSPAHLQTHETARGGPPGTQSPPKALKVPRRGGEREGGAGWVAGREDAFRLLMKCLVCRLRMKLSSHFYSVFVVVFHLGSENVERDTCVFSAKQKQPSRLFLN